MTTPVIVQKAPMKVTVEAGKTYYWCACGRSNKQPFCDGSHKVTEITPIPWEATESGDKFFCACKHTGNKPFCDGTHKTLG